MIKRLSVIIPVYGNGTTIRELRDRLDDVLRSLPVDDHELIFVDDASPDDSWEVIEALADMDPSVVGLRLDANVGQPTVYCAGIDAASGDVLATIDADLEHPPEALGQLVDGLGRGHDLVVARRVGRTTPPLRRLGSWAVEYLAGVLGLRVTDAGSTFVVATADVAAEIRRLIAGTRRQMVLGDIVGEAARNPVVVDVEMASSATSRYSLRRLVGRFSEFVATELGSRSGRWVVAVGGCVLAAGLRPRWRRWALPTGGLVTGLGLLALLAQAALPGDRTGSVYEVAARVGSGPQRVDA
ncbi:MAG: glycosyltransferase [Acidobacteria bacterium]|nr:glycosyltransferase [Acidobacteriota bacterium]